MKIFGLFLFWLFGIALNFGLLAGAVWVVIYVLRATGVL